MPETNTRRVYFVYYNMGTNTNYIKFVNVTPTGISSPYTVASFLGNTKVFEPNEVEISRDKSMLIFTRPKKFNPNSNDYSNDLTIVHLNPSTGYLNTSGGTNGYTYVDFGAQNSYNDKYVGCEFDEDENNIYITGNGRLYKYNISSTTVTEYSENTTDNIANSQLEYSRNGYIYGIDASGQLYTISSSGSFAISGLDPLGSSAVISNSYYGSGITTRTLPDQIDGYDYDGLWGDEDYCCYIYLEDEELRVLPGVTFESNDDITIESGYATTWTTTSNPFTPSGVAITDVYLKGSIEIEKNAALSLYGLTLHFKEDEGLNMIYTDITTEKGSKLNLLSGAKLTVFDECDEEALWLGVDCLGYWDYSQIPYYNSKQPYVYMATNTTIEFAELGIDASGGGIVRASSSDFKDNIMDLKFAGSDNFDECVISNSSFYTTSELYAKSHNPTWHVQLWMGDGVVFKGCEFINDYGYSHSVSIANWGSGILSTYTDFTVEESTTTRGSFEHLYYGLKVEEGDYFALSQTDLLDCYRSTWVIANDGVSVTECDFNLANNFIFSNFFNYNFGLYLESCTGYLVTENNFHDGKVGLIVYNSGDDHNEIYKNYFEDIVSTNGNTCSIIGIGDNSGFPEKVIGLQIKCNEFDNVDYSISVVGGNLNVSPNSTIYVSTSDIAQHQYVSANGLSQKSAMNYWTNMPTPNDDYRYFYVNPSHSVIANNGRYQYHCPNTTGYYLPTGSFNPLYVARDTMAASTCPSILSPSKSLSIPNLISQTQDYTEYEAGLQNELDELTSYDELNLEISAQTSSVNNTSEVYNNLYEQSPYLTSAILLAYLNNTNVSELSRTSLMIANSPLPTDIVDAVEESDLSAQYKAYILTNQEGENPIEFKQTQINGIESARQVNYDHIVRATFSSDTTPDFAETYNMVLGFMETQSDLHARKKLADMYSHKNMFEDALSLLSEIENIALSTEDISLYNHVKLREINIDIKRTNSFEEAQNVIRENEEYLGELAADYNTKEGGAARAMLESVGLFENFPVVFFPNPEITMEDRAANANNTVFEDNLVPELESLFSIYPNPANDYLSIEFINPEGACSFNIYNTNGALVKTISTNQSLGFMSIDVSQLGAGNYIITCPELESNQNFVIVR